MPEALITRGLADVLVDRIVAALVASEVQQVALDPAVGYDVTRDNFEPLPRKPFKPKVNVYFQALNPETSGNSTRGPYAENAQITIDMIVKENDPDEVDKTADIIAEARLHYLREQVRIPLFDLRNRHWGFSPGVIGNKSNPSYTRLENEDDNQEQAVIAGRWTFSVNYAWQPLTADGVPLNEITIDTSLFSLLYTYPEEGN